MIRPWALFVLAVLLAGCRSTPQGDPFLLGRSTVPPPGTGAIGQPGAASLAPPAGTTIPQQTVAPTGPPTINSVPINPAPPSMNSPPINNPYNFRQGSLQKSSAEATASNWAPTRQAVATMNRAATSDPTAATTTAAKTVEASGSAAADAASDTAEETPKTTIKVASLEESAIPVRGKSAAANDETAKSGAATSIPEPNRFTPPDSVIRIVEPGAKDESDSAASVKQTNAMTASSFQPQWQKWTDDAAR